MVKRQKSWIYSPPKMAKPQVPDTVKTRVKIKASELIDSVLKPEHVKPPPEDNSFNYIVDIYAKWYRNYFYFCAKYRCPDPNCISEFFEERFARLEYVENDCFNLSYMRHTENWWEIYTGLSLDECLSAIKDEPHFMP